MESCDKEQAVLRRIHPAQLEEWLRKLQHNMMSAPGENASREEKLTFIRNQYALLDRVVRVCDGNVYFVGCSRPPNR